MTSTRITLGAVGVATTTAALVSVRASERKEKGMMAMQTRRTFTSRLTVGVLGAAALIGGAAIGTGGFGAAPAQAHNYVVATNPAADATLSEQPGTISVTTNNALIDVGGQSDVLQVTGPSGYYGDGCTLVDGPTASMATVLGEPGVYTVLWQVVSTDGHPVSGQFTFTWQPAEGQELGGASAEVPVCGQQSPPATSPSTTEPTDEASTPPSHESTPSTAPEDAARDDAASTAVGVIAGIGSALAVLVIAAVVVVLVSRRRSKLAQGDSAAGTDDGTQPPAE